MAEGKHPYAKCTSFAEVINAVCTNDPPSLSSSTWSSDFVEFISKCLVKDVNERWSVIQLMDVRLMLWYDEYIPS